MRRREASDTSGLLESADRAINGALAKNPCADIDNSALPWRHTQKWFVETHNQLPCLHSCTGFVVHSRHVFQHLTVDDFRINHGIPVGLASRVLELFEVPVTVNPAGILPLRLFAAEDGTSHGGGAGSLAESLFAFEGTTSLERGRAAFRRSGSNNRSIIEKRFAVSKKVPRLSKSVALVDVVYPLRVSKL